MNTEVRLNHIGDEAADELQSFYQGWLDGELSGSAKYEAHLYLGLLAWRAGQFEAMKEHLHLAAKTAVELYCRRGQLSGSENHTPFEFMIPLFVVFIFGDREDRKKLAAVRRTAWVSPEQEEYASLIELLDLLKVNMTDYRFDEQALQEIIKLNEHYTTHPFYQPWVEAMCRGLLAALHADREGVEAACREMLTMHEEEALEGEWTLRLESVLAFWVLALMRVTRMYGVTLSIESPYVPPLENL